jgi:hypothetical protein
MDFRDPNVVGTFVYHCHILEHEDKGMMGSIRVDPGPDHSDRNAQALRQSMPGRCKDGDSSASCQDSVSRETKSH